MGHLLASELYISIREFHFYQVILCYKDKLEDCRHQRWQRD